MTTGSVAAMLYGEPRLTNDIDIVIELQRIHEETFPALFPPSQFYCPPAEVLAVERGRAQRGHFNLLHHETGFKADIYLSGRDPLHDWGLARRRRIDILEESGLWVAPPEYVILRKLQYYQEGGSEKHVLDIQAMLELSSDDIDMAALHQWIDQLALQKEWQHIGM